MPFSCACLVFAEQSCRIPLVRCQSLSCTHHAPERGRNAPCEKSLRGRVADLDPDPHKSALFGTLDPDPHQSEKLDPNSHYQELGRLKMEP
jgi:hypothetical protein